MEWFVGSSQIGTPNSLNPCCSGSPPKGSSNPPRPLCGPNSGPRGGAPPRLDLAKPLDSLPNVSRVGMTSRGSAGGPQLCSSQGQLKGLNMPQLSNNQQSIFDEIFLRNRISQTLSESTHHHIISLDLLQKHRRNNITIPSHLLPHRFSKWVSIDMH